MKKVLAISALVGTAAAAQCDTSSWSGVRGGQHCSSCKVLAYTDGRYFQDKSLPKSCAGYCLDKGRACVGAWEENDNSCSAERGMTCDETQNSKDSICQCGNLLQK